MTTSRKLTVASKQTSTTDSNPAVSADADAVAPTDTAAVPRRRRSRKVTAAQATPAPAPQAAPALASTNSPVSPAPTSEKNSAAQSGSTANSSRKRRRVTASQVSVESAAPARTKTKRVQSKSAAKARTANEPQTAAPVNTAPSLAETAAPPVAEPAFLPAASLLFQAPDPARARRRSLTPATDAQESADANQQINSAKPRRGKAKAAPVAASTTVGAADAAAEKDESRADDAELNGVAASTDAAGRRKRRRGVRGRRSRVRTDASAPMAEASEELTAESASRSAATDKKSRNQAAAEVPSATTGATADEEAEASAQYSVRRRRRRTRTAGSARDEVTVLKGSTRLEAKRQRRREERAAGRRRPIITEAEFLARRERVDRQMIVREQDGLNQIAVLEDGILVEHYVARHTQTSMVGNVYVGRVQNVLPSMEAAFIDLGKGRNAVLYSGEVNWALAGMDGKPRRIEDALKSGDTVMVQVTKDPIGHKGARLTSQITLAGRYLVFVPNGSMTGISRKLPDNERRRLKSILKHILPDSAGVIVRTAAEGASEEQLRADIERLSTQWAKIEKKSKQVLSGYGKAPVLLKGEPELAVRVVRDVFNEDFRKLVVQGAQAWKTISAYVKELSPDLVDRLEHWVEAEDVFSAYRIDEQLAKGFDRKVWLPSGGTLIIDRTEAMTVIDVNTGRFTGAGGTLEETITRNNLEAAEEIVRQLRLRDIGGMVVIDFVDMVLESNRDLVLRRLVECLGRDRTRHQVTEVTSLGLVQMTRKRVGQGLVEAFSVPCECCGGRGFLVQNTPVEDSPAQAADKSHFAGHSKKESKFRGRKVDTDAAADNATRAAVRGAFAQIAAAAEQAHERQEDAADAPVSAPVQADLQEAESASAAGSGESYEQ